MLKLKRLALGLMIMPALYRFNLFAVGGQKNEVEKLSLKKGRAMYVANFAEDIERYYGDAHWVCRAFEYMNLQEFVAGWQQLSVFIGNEYRRRWFYAHDTKKVYDERLNVPYSHLKRYNRESLDVEWFRECKFYHKFLKRYVVDTENMIIVKKDTKECFKSSYKKRYLVLQDILVQRAAPALLTFYQFFFEQISNVMLKKLNYLHENTEVEIDNIVQLINHKALMSEIYRICVHKTGQSSSDYARKMAYHYNRTESVLDMVVSDVLKRLGVA